MNEHTISRRKFLQISGFVSVGAVIAGCSAPAAPTTANTSDSPETERVLVTYWNYMTDVEAIETPILEDFNATSSTTTVAWEYIPWQQYWQKLNATLAAADPPHLWNTAPTFYYEYILRDQLADLTDYVEPNINMETFHETALSGYDFDGKLYGIPRNIVTNVVFFNKDLFSQAGVEPPPLDGNWTYLDMLEKALGVTQSGDAQTWGTNALQSAVHLDPVIMSNGGEIFRGEFRRDLVGMEANYDSEEAYSTFKYMVDLINEHQVAFPAGEFDGMGDPFMTGRVGMIWGLNWGALTFADAPFDWDLTMAPQGSEAHLTYGGADGLVISNNVDNKDGAWELAMWLIDPVTGGPFLTNSGAMPVIATEEAMEAYRQTFPEKNIQAFIDSAAIARNTFTLGFNEWKSALQSELDQAFLGQKPTEQMVEDANLAVNEALERIRAQFTLSDS